jgi:site-specific DNA recombinase
MRKAVIYARVSSKEQQESGFSIPSQKRLLQDYATKNHFEVVRIYEEAETAKRSGRNAFNEMLKFFRKNSSCQVLLVEKTDRLYRNLKDYTTIDELGLELHLVKENCVLSSTSRSSEKFMHGIKVLVAKNYIDNLSEESSKGMMEKARQGLYPSNAPIGYLNNRETRTIYVDKHKAPEIRRLFEHYATFKPSFKAMSKFATAIGLQSKRGTPLSPEVIRAILRNPIYIGDIRWKGEYFAGKHEPIVSRELFQAVQDRFGGTNVARPRRHNFAFRGFLHCGNCGCLVTAERQKEKHVYYHCTHMGSPCKEKSVKEEALADKLGELIKPLVIDNERAEWIREALVESHGDQEKDREKRSRETRRQIDEVERMQSMLYEDKLKGVVTPHFWETKYREFEAKLESLRADLVQLANATGSYYEEGLRLLELSQGAYSLYVKSNYEEKRKILDLLYSNCTLQGQEVVGKFRQPLQMIIDASAAEKRMRQEKRSTEARNEVWYPRQDLNLWPPD